MQGADERVWVERVLPDYDNLRTAFDRASEDRDVDLVLRLVTSLPELVFDREMKQLPIIRDSWHGEWNYTLLPTRDTPDPP